MPAGPASAPIPVSGPPIPRWGGLPPVVPCSRSSAARDGRERGDGGRDAEGGSDVDGDIADSTADSTAG
ncbi:hypothetical protein B0H14DRAFT_3451522 [Mycena olivaceomarginata]|nr:hypothetical protein B0H14DRAFT_3451522 [Mycena olivaceomarginata]